jgi:hypothetical protein
MGGIPKFMLTVAHKQITQSVALFASFLQKKFGEMDRPSPLQISLTEPMVAQKDPFESDDDSFCSLESFDDEEFSIVDASQEIHRIIPQISSNPLSSVPVNTQPSGPLKQTTHIQEQTTLKSQQPQQHQQPQQLEKQNYQWQNKNPNTNNKTLPRNEKVEKKTGNYLESGNNNNSDAIITNTLLELKKNVANLQLQIDRIERLQSRNSILTHLFYISWPIVVVVAYHIFRKKLA